MYTCCIKQKQKKLICSVQELSASTYKKNLEVHLNLNNPDADQSLKAEQPKSNKVQDLQVNAKKKALPIVYKQGNFHQGFVKSVSSCVKGQLIVCRNTKTSLQALTPITAWLPTTSMAARMPL